MATIAIRPGRQNGLMVTLGLALCLAVSGCAVRFISAYDQTTDNDITALQKKTDDHLVSLDAFPMPKPTDAAPSQAFATILSDVNNLKFRNEQREKNKETSRQIELLQELLGQFQQEHAAAVKTPGAGMPAEEKELILEDAAQVKSFITGWRKTFNHAYGTMLRLELLKKET